MCSYLVCVHSLNDIRSEWNNKLTGRSKSFPKITNLFLQFVPFGICDLSRVIFRWTMYSFCGITFQMFTISTNWQCMTSSLLSTVLIIKRMWHNHKDDKKWVVAYPFYHSALEMWWFMMSIHGTVTNHRTGNICAKSRVHQKYFHSNDEVFSCLRDLFIYRSVFFCEYLGKIKAFSCSSSANISSQYIKLYEPSQR